MEADKMNSIITFIQEPQNWLNALFPLVLMWVARKVFPPIIEFFKSLTRRSRLAELKKIRQMRGSTLQVQFQISKCSAYFTVFLLSILIFYIAVLFPPLSSIAKESHIAFLLLTSPIYVFQYLWLIQYAFTKSLIKHADKLKKFYPFSRQNY